MKLILKCKICDRIFEYDTDNILGKCPFCQKTISMYNETKIKQFSNIEDIEIVGIAYSSDSKYVLKDLNDIYSLYIKGDKNTKEKISSIFRYILFIISNKNGLDEIYTLISNYRNKRIDERNIEIQKQLEGDSN